MKVAGRVAVVTGGGRGIGEAIANRLAAEGADVAIWDVDGSRANGVAEDLVESYRVRASGFEVDIASSESVDAALVSTEEQLGAVAILVNNAGVDVIGPFLESDVADWDRIIAVNLKGTILCCHRVASKMVERGSGRIVNIGSDAGRVGSSGEAVYSATKGGVMAFTKTLARELASKGVTVNAISPGPTETALLGQVVDESPKLYDALTRAIPLRRIGQPDDIAPAVVFLASDDAAYITGQTLSVSGGLTMQ